MMDNAPTDTTPADDDLSPARLLRRIDVALAAGETGAARTAFDMVCRAGEGASFSGTASAFLVAIGRMAPVLIAESPEAVGAMCRRIEIEAVRWLEAPRSALLVVNDAAIDALVGILNTVLAEADVGQAMLVRDTLDVWTSRVAMRLADIDGPRGEADPLVVNAQTAAPLVLSLAAAGRFADAVALAARIAVLRDVAIRLTQESGDPDILDTVAAAETEALCGLGTMARMMGETQAVAAAREGLAGIETLSRRRSHMPRTLVALTRGIRAA
jgi:hypothetical protein